MPVAAVAVAGVFDGQDKEEDSAQAGHCWADNQTYLRVSSGLKGRKGSVRRLKQVKVADAGRRRL